MRASHTLSVPGIFFQIWRRRSYDSAQFGRTRAGAAAGHETARSILVISRSVACACVRAASEKPVDGSNACAARLRNSSPLAHRPRRVGNPESQHGCRSRPGTGIGPSSLFTFQTLRRAAERVFFSLLFTDYSREPRAHDNHLCPLC